MARLHYSELWDAIKAQANSDLLKEILGNMTGVFMEGDDYSEPLGDDAPKGRVVIVPADTAWGAASGVGPTRDAAFLTRVEFSDFRRAGYDVNVSLDAAQDELESRLVGFTPSLTRIKLIVPIYLYAGRQPWCLWDPDRGLWFTSAQYRLEVAKG